MGSHDQVHFIFEKPVLAAVSKVRYAGTAKPCGIFFEIGLEKKNPTSAMGRG